MKVKLRIKSDDSLVYEGAYDIRDAETFGSACADAWEKLRTEQHPATPPSRATTRVRTH
jgi:hypothetical protein